MNLSVRFLPVKNLPLRNGHIKPTFSSGLECEKVLAAVTIMTRITVNMLTITNLKKAATTTTLNNETNLKSLHLHTKHLQFELWNNTANENVGNEECLMNTISNINSSNQYTPFNKLKKFANKKTYTVYILCELREMANFCNDNKQEHGNK